MKSKETTTVYQIQSCAIWQSDTFSPLGPLEHIGQSVHLGGSEHSRDGFLAHWHTFWHAGMMAHMTQKAHGTGTLRSVVHTLQSV